MTVVATTQVEEEGISLGRAWALELDVVRIADDQDQGHEVQGGSREGGCVRRSCARLR